ncbi:pilus assembly protein [Streptomyces sp. MUM 203J]|uniref:TadE/TadG family type IV pilus assembly protein n=1 Tax=Streptomyces sp. MUM 203J TaxID=2791990 RepID=UPI001F033FF1|nr:TadE/TadG family type IV pilus assembly protein [Streptomyces sp. MUM 203J]MCH0541078.1 pilus assembly protein [Streptomyces sp. MUM 203J]
MGRRRLLVAGLRGRPYGDRGQLAVEFAGLLPVVLVTIAVLWQAALTGYAFVLAGNAADRAARAAATGEACGQAGREHLPGGWTARISCGRDGDMVRAEVAVRVPVLFPGGADFPLEISGRAGAAREARP